MGNATVDFGVYRYTPFRERPRYSLGLLCRGDHVGLDIAKDMPVKNGVVVSRMAQVGGFPRLQNCGPTAPATHSLEEEPHPVPGKFSGKPQPAVDSAKKN